MVLFAALFTFSCAVDTDLEESLPSELTEDNFGQTDEQILSSIGETYTLLAGGGGWGGSGGIWSIHEITSDEIVVPHKGQVWFDGGHWLRYHRHTFTVDESLIENAWSRLFRGVNTSNRLIEQLQLLVDNGNIEASQADPFIAELRALRAFYYFWLLDTFGNVPIITEFSTASANPANNADFQQGRTELFNFIEGELLAVADLVSDDVANTRGRLNKYGVHTLLGKLYLNAEVYIHTPRYQDAVDQFDIVIDSGEYSLMQDFFVNFSVNAEGSTENIFVIPFDETFLPGMNINQMTIHWVMQFEFDLAEQPWGGFATVEEFYNSYDDEDIRKQGFLVGQRYSSSGEELEDPDYEGAPIDDDPKLTLRPSFNEIAPNSCRECGARFAKFEIEQGARPDMNNDFPLLRYADVLLSKGEALWRMNEGSEEARLLVNMIRDRADLDGYDQLTAENLLAERGRELFLEMWRRQDLIRFEGQDGGATAFNDAWWAKEQSESYRNVFPIPSDQIAANENLKQNPGY